MKKIIVGIIKLIFLLNTTLVYTVTENQFVMPAGASSPLCFLILLSLRGS